MDKETRPPRAAVSGQRRRSKTEPIQPPTPLRRQPPGSLDRLLSDTIDQLRQQRTTLSKNGLGLAAGRDSSHAGRMLGPDGPRQAWTLDDLRAYGGALGMTVGQLMVAAGLVESRVDTIDVVSADRTIPVGSRQAIVEMIRVARLAPRE